MKDSDREILKTSLDDIYRIKDKFLDFKLETKKSLLLSQLQLLQTLGGISLALITVGVGTNNVDLGVWVILSIIFAVILLVYSTSFSREVIDFQDQGLFDAEIHVNEIHNMTEKKILEAFEKDDASIFYAFSQEQIEKSKKDDKEAKLYTGEISLFIFYEVILNGFFGVLDVNFKWYILVIGLIFVYIISTKNWAIKFTTFLSNLFKTSSPTPHS